MSGQAKDMRIAGTDRSPELQHRLQQAARLSCAEHGQRVDAAASHGRENGWFSSTWTTCCSDLERTGASILKDHC